MPEPQPPYAAPPTPRPAPPPQVPPPGAGGYPPPQVIAYAPPPRKRSIFKTFLMVLLIAGLAGSILMNLALMAGLALTADVAGLQTTVVDEGKPEQTVALYTVSGVIDARAATEFAQFYKAVENDQNVKAVVLRINSPGGGVTSSDQMCQTVRMLKQLRRNGRGVPVVVSMGSLAASGGYYISAPADEIFAESTTVTGSIGVIAGWVVLKGTLDKIGAEPVVIKSTHARGWKDEISPYAHPHDYQIEHLQGVLDKMQERFEAVVTEGRGSRLKTREASFAIPPAEEGGEPTQHVETEPFNGKIYLAEDALELGMIDTIGYSEDATDRAAKLAGLTNHRVVRYAPRLGFFAMIARSQAADSTKLDASLLDKFQTPRFQMLWKAD